MSLIDKLLRPVESLVNIVVFWHLPGIANDSKPVEYEPYKRNEPYYIRNARESNANNPPAGRGRAKR